ncbi:MAG TPA: hypothetical protein VEL11_12820 [Candidatus Bathyarchaeia archaeon]|nr:hypothetical protein [Candidatus Bathyarchaeia archaeon]
MQKKLRSSNTITAHASEILVPKWRQYKKTQIEVPGFRNHKLYTVLRYDKRGVCANHTTLDTNVWEMLQSMI